MPVSILLGLIWPQEDQEDGPLFYPLKGLRSQIWFETSSSLRNGSAQCYMNMIILYSKGQLLKKENKKSLGVFYFSKLVYCLGGPCKTSQGITRYYKVLQYMECLESNILKIQMFEF